MTFVIDSSVLMSFLLPDEQDERALLLLDRLSEEGGFAPILLKYEVMNSLLAAERRGRITAFYRQRPWDQFQRMLIQFDSATAPNTWQQTAELAVKHGLTGYDAVYLALALNHGLPVATFDKQIIAAARSLSVPIL